VNIATVLSISGQTNFAAMMMAMMPTIKK